MKKEDKRVTEVNVKIKEAYEIPIVNEKEIWIIILKKKKVVQSEKIGYGINQF